MTSLSAAIEAVAWMVIMLNIVKMMLRRYKNMVTSFYRSKHLVKRGIVLSVFLVNVCYIE